MAKHDPRVTHQAEPDETPSDVGASVLGRLAAVGLAVLVVVAMLVLAIYFVAK